MRRSEAAAVGALGFILAVTAVWWALALWPLPEATPGWLVRARLVCFASPPGGLPDLSGWILLIGEPLGMLGALWVIGRAELTGGLRALRGRPGGRLVVAAGGMLVLAGLAAAALRIAGARRGPDPAALMVAAADVTALDRPAPPLALVDQHGAPLTLDRFRGRAVLVTFAFGHCETVCPLLVREVLAARRAAHGVPPAVVIVTLDPRRDTPTRLPHLAAAWALDADVWVAGGPVSAVEATIDAWDVPRRRDPRTGDVVHPPVVFVVDGAGRVAYRVAGGGAPLGGLLRRLGALRRVGLDGPR